MNPVAGKEFDGSSPTTRYSIDGNGTDSSNNHSPDSQVLIRFNNIIGSGAGLIPANASILDAQLQFTTSVVGNGQTGGPVGASALLGAFDSNTSYYTSYSCGTCTFVSRGPWWQDNSATRANGGIGTTAQGAVGSLDVRSIVQQWTNGTLANFGMAVQQGFTGSTDAWTVASTGNATVTDRPKLAVTYTTDPVGVKTIQKGTNGYAGEVDMLMKSGTDLTSDTDDANVVGSGQTSGQNIDGALTGTSERAHGMLKFSDIFGNQAWEAPANKPVLKGWLVMTTGGGTNARSPGPMNLYAMLRPWDTTTKYSSFGATPGLQEADGDISPLLAAKSGMITGSEAWFDVTSYLEAIRTGTPDNGLAIVSTVDDGWQAFLSGASAASRPRLVIYSDLSTAPTGILGDYNGNTVVDAADYVLWRKGGALQNQGDDPNNVNSADYTYWRSRFGATTNPGAGAGFGSSAVPEPATWVLGCVTGLALFLTIQRKRPNNEF